LSFAGNAGSVESTVGASTVESSTYSTEVEEQAETFPAASVAVAWKVVVESSGTLTRKPTLANLDSGPPAAAVPEQSSVV
jgi:hypothetical protein